MYNNLLRKITSLSLLTILLTSTAVLALPTALPAAHAQVASHPNLFVSAENSQWNNYFAGPQVVQVIVADPNINRLDQAYGEPVVTVNGKRLRMAQATDGNWYGYFADRNQAIAASKTVAVNGTGLDFGLFCGPNSPGFNPKSGVDYTQTKGFTIARDISASLGGSPFNFVNASKLTSNGSNLPSCSGGRIAQGTVGAFYKGAIANNVVNNATANYINGKTAVKTIENVIRENKTLNTNTLGFAAGFTYSSIWPVIQLYDFSAIPTPVTVDYSAAGGDQIVNLTFDRIPSNLISVIPDRTAYPENAQVFLTMNDPQLNIDPTEEDSWTWGANVSNNQVYYMAFDRNGIERADGTSGPGLHQPAMQNLIGNLTTFMFNHNGKFTFNPTAQSVRIVDFQSNGKASLNESPTTIGNPSKLHTQNVTALSLPITFLEQGGVNTGVFGNWDGGKKSNIVTLSPSEETTGSIRGQSSTFKYNDIGGSIVGGFAFASISMTAKNGTWQGGTRIPVTLTDADSNKNSKITEHLNNYDPKYDRIAAMKIGTPFTLFSGGNPSSNFNMGPEVAFIFSTSSANTASNLPGVLTRASTTLNFTTALLHNGNSTLTWKNPTLANNSAQYAAGTNIAVDESFSNRPVFSFTNSTTLHNNGEPVSMLNEGGVFINLNTTAQTLFNTINDPTNGTAVSKFKGFNFLNYDMRTFSSIAGANNTATQVSVYLVYNQTASSLVGANGLPRIASGSARPQTDIAVSLANSTNLQDFINLNQTFTISNKLTNPAEAKYGFDLIHAIKNNIPLNAKIGLLFTFGIPTTTHQLALNTNGTAKTAFTADFFSVGIIGDGITNQQRVNNGIYRWELEETGDNTGVFTGTNQFLLVNQLNIFDPLTYSQLRTVNHDVLFVAVQDMLQAEARAPQITYLDLGADGVNTQVSAQQDIPTHTGVVSFDQKTYKVGDTVTISVNDQDLNTNNDLVVIYTAVTPQNLATVAGNHNGVEDVATDTIGKANLGTYSDGTAFGRLLDVQFGQQDIRWSDARVPNANNNTVSCFQNAAGLPNEGNAVTPLGFASSLSATGFSLVETAAGSGIFQGTFEVPDKLCQNGVTTTSNGQNIKVNYVDFLDDSGKRIEVSDNAGIRGNTGSVKLDKAVYPVPFGSVGGSSTSPTADFVTSTTITSEPGVFPMHRDTVGLPGTTLTTNTPCTGLCNLNTLSHGDVIVHARVNDPDYSLASTGTSSIAVGVFNGGHGPVAFQITRQSSSMLLATAGGPAKRGGTIVDLNGTGLPAQNNNAWSQVPELGPMAEISPGAGIFQADLPIRYSDGPRGTDCPVPSFFDGGINGTGFTTNENKRFYTVHTNTANDPTTGNYCVRQGDVLTVTYFDTSDASGHPQTVTDSATFDLRNGVLQSDKSVYIIGSDMILTLVEPDLNLDSQQAETVPLDVVEWDSHAFKGTMGPLGGQQAAFDAKPSTFVETGKDTGIFQAVIKIPKQLGTNLLERGEQIHLEYTDWGPAGSKVVGANNQDIELTIYTSNFGATVELDQKVYTWTDRVYITVVAPDHNFDPNLVDIIGDNSENTVAVSTRGHSIFYKLTETGVDTGIFTGYVILTGDPTLKGSGGTDGSGTEPTGIIGNGSPNSCTQSAPCGPTDGFLPAEDSDGVSVSFEFTRDQTVTGSALIRWNIGEIKWLQPSYPANGQGVLQIVDPDMNLNPKAVDKFDTSVWSDSDSGGIKLTMTETGQDTGIFQGTVYFTTNFQSSGNRLHVAEGDTVTGEYKDRTLPAPYTPADQLRLTATTFIGTIVPPLERAPATNPRIVDSFGNAITGAVKVGQQIQVTADLANGQDRDQPFAYLVQIQDANGVTVSLSWITGTLTAGQSLNPAQSWTPSASGTYTAQIFVWQSIDNPNALSPPLSTTINVQ
jgi:hypothetical protein